jgi:hypothetical protein
MRLKIPTVKIAGFNLFINNFDLLLAAASLFALHIKYLVDPTKMAKMRIYRMYGQGVISKMFMLLSESKNNVQFSYQNCNLERHYDALHIKQVAFEILNCSLTLFSL